MIRMASGGGFQHEIVSNHVLFIDFLEQMQHACLYMSHVFPIYFPLVWPK